MSEQGRSFVGRVSVDHAERFLSRSAEGGFVLRGADGECLRADPAPGGWGIDGLAGAGPLRLERIRGEAPGFVLRGPEDRSWVGRTMPLVGVRTGLRFLLLDDGRLFRIAPREGREPGYELLGWEAPGAYLVVRPGKDGWSIGPQAACGGIPDIRVITLLLAAEILDAEEPLREQTT